MNDIQIEKGVPLPEYGKLSGSLRRMGIGDSILFPSVHSASLQSILSRLRKGSPGLKFTSRKTEGGIRVWRLA